MDFLLELVLEIIMELLVEGVKSKKLHRIIRVIIFTILFLIYLAIIGMLVFFTFVIDVHMMVKVFFLGVALFLGVFLVRLIKELVNTESN